MHIRAGLLILPLIILPFIVSCSEASMDAAGTNSNLNSPGGNTGPIGPGCGGSCKAEETFTSSAALKKIDILFVDDNSASMDTLQSSLGSKFPALATAIAGLDWQIGITTTDCSTDKWGICGSLLPLTGWSGNILSPSIPSYQTVFNNSIVRPETIGCVQRGACPSGIAEPLLSTMTAFDKRATNDYGFFRNGAALAVVILTDADEMMNGPSNATQAASVITHFNSIWGQSKQFKAYAIDIIPNDSACLQQYTQTAGGLTYYGVQPSSLASQTGGLSESICAADYTPLLQAIGTDMQNAPTSLQLKYIPVGANAVTVTFNPSPGVTEAFNLTNNILTFSPPLPQGTVITVDYSY